MNSKLAKAQSTSKPVLNLGASLPKLNTKAIRAAHNEKNDTGACQNFPLHRKKIIALLNVAVSNELVNMLRYRHHHNLSLAMDVPELSRDFLKYANQELAHADKIAKRIFELNGTADCSPRTLAKQKRNKFKAHKSIASVLNTDLACARAMIETYRQIITRISSYDAATCEMLEKILTLEEKNMAELNRHLLTVNHSESII
jgi:bacterioferritin